MGSRRASLLCLLCACGLFAAGTAQADWKRDYDRGVKAAESGDWAEVESLMRSALASESEPDSRKRFQGTVIKPYVPHYFLGLAAYRQGRCAAAMNSWNNRASSAVVSGLSEFNAVQSQGVADCTRKLAAAAPPTPPVVVATAPPKPTQTTSKPAPPPVSKPVAQKPTAPANNKPTQVATTPPPAPKSAAPAPASLVSALEDYLAGRYQKVLQLDPGSIADGRSRAQAYLLRAAARFTQAELDDSGVQALALVRQDVRAARGANSGLSPDAVLFSPRFRELWQQAR
jgi:hypothetical protein